jgi:RNA polymerase sigma factor (sigma-70 family)
MITDAQIVNIRPLIAYRARMIAKRYGIRCPDQIEDLLSIGMLAVVRVAKRYKPELASWRTYATTCSVLKMMNAAADMKWSIKKARHRCEVKGGRSPYIRRLAMDIPYQEPVKGELDGLLPLARRVLENERAWTIVSRLINGETQSSLANELRMNRAWLQQIWNKALKALRDHPAIRAACGM